MIVQCQKCETTFKVDEGLIKPTGTRLRCANCKHVFKVYPSDGSPSPPPDKSPPQPMWSKPQERERQRLKAEITRTLMSDDTQTVGFSERVFEVIRGNERYIEMGSIGKGGMGEVRLARDAYLLRKVAVKVLRTEAASPAALTYFLREAQITAQLDHPNIVPLYTVKQPVGNEQNVSFVMKFIKGKTLGDVIARARQAYKQNPKIKLDKEMDLRTRLDYFLKTCEGIIYAHSKNVVHRDLKPANIMVGDYGEVYIMDWGIAKVVGDMPETLMGIQEVAAQKLDEYSEDTKQGNVVGTPGYMSPEQVRGLPDVGSASDQFSLGVILSELVTLQPGRTGDMHTKLEWAREGYINPVVHYVSSKKVAPELKAIIEKATAQNPQDRYSSVGGLAEDIRCFLRGDEVSELPDNLPKKVWRWMNKHRYLTLVTILSLLLLSAGLTIGTLYREQRSIKAAQWREKQLTRLLSDVSAHAHKIDRHFLRLEDLLINLANDAIYLIEKAPDNNEQLFWLEDFQNPEQAPPDLLYSSLYKREVSIEYPVVKLAPGVRQEDVLPIMERLAPLRHHFKKLLLDSRNTLTPVSDEEARRLITIHGLPVSWAYIGLASGVMYSYPGKGTYSEEYDPRQRPWYRLGAHKNAVYWGNPYVDVQGMGVVLACATSLYGEENRFYGVVGMDVTYKNLIQENLTRMGARGVKESYLLDEKGRIVIRSSQLNMELDPEKSGAGLELKTFPIAEVVQTIHRSESGLMELERAGELQIFVYQQIRSLDWYYVEQIDSNAILESRNSY